ncbi:hypothetical protein D3C73_788180 [compost metagenome]
MIKVNKWLGVVAFLGIGVSLYLAIQYLWFGANQAAFVLDKWNEMQLLDLWYVMLYIHIITAIVAISIGWLQFISKLRAKSTRFHKMIGRIYSGCVVLSGLSGIYLSFYATGGLISSIGFFLLSLSWLYTLIRGIRAISVNKDRIAHQKWMTRNYALTFAAVTLRIYLPVSMLIFGLEYFNEYYRVIAWLCWIPNWIVAELILKRQKISVPSSNQSTHVF